MVEPELDAEKKPTGFYLVTIGEGRRLAQLLRVKRKQIKKTEGIRCVIDTANDPFEISLDENVTRTAMHPADQFEAFRELAEHRGWGAEEIAARFGVTAHVVKQRLRLGAVSPRLMQVYRDGGLTLDQLRAFAITEDHARQERVYENLSYNRDPSFIRRDIMKTHIPATDRRAIFIGAEVYTEAGGNIVRDLFTEDRGGFYEDAALLSGLSSRNWKASPRRFRRRKAGSGFRFISIIPRPRPAAHLSASGEAFRGRRSRLRCRTGGNMTACRRSMKARGASRRRGPTVRELEAEIERIDAKRHAYDPDEIARGGVFVVLSPDGEARIERGFIRPEDEKPEAEEASDGETVIDGVRVNGDGEIIEDGDDAAAHNADDEDAGDDGTPLSDLLVRELTTHRTLGLRVALGEQPDMALIAVTHALAAQSFYRGGDAHCLDIRTVSPLGGHADGIEDTAAAKALADRHAGWAADMPRDVADLWGFITGLDHASVMALFAHCASQTVNAVKVPWERKPRARLRRLTSWQAHLRST